MLPHLTRWVQSGSPMNQQAMVDALTPFPYLLHTNQVLSLTPSVTNYVTS